MSGARVAWIVLLGCALAVAGCSSAEAPRSDDSRVKLADGRTGVRTASGHVRLDTGEVVDESGDLVLDENPATVELLCEAMAAQECSAAWQYDQCLQWFTRSKNSEDCADEVHTLLNCVDMDVRFECDYNGVPYPRGVVEDPETALLDEYCEEEWFSALACVGNENDPGD